MIDGRLEFPLPVLTADTDYLFIETTDTFEGSFKIKNTGGSTLSGKILSRARALTFSPDKWEGNEQTVTYRYNPSLADGLKPGETLETYAYICSNGGEKKLPVTVKLTKMAITSPEGWVIANIRDFYDYALEYPAQARRLFTDGEFYMLLLATGYPYMEAYEMLHKDPNRERSMDNFFILSGLKKKTGFNLQTHLIEYLRKPNETSPVYGNFLIRKTDGGFFETPVQTLNNEPWLTLSTERLISNDFNEASAAVINFSIDPLQIEGRYAKETVIIGAELELDGGNAVDIVFRREIPLSFRLKREGYAFEDKGFIEVINNTGEDIVVEVFCKDSFIRFAARKYLIGAAYDIPFDVRLSGFMAAQLLFRKLPTDTGDGFADERVTKTAEEYPLGRWQLDADGRWRSSGDRLIGVEEFVQMYKQNPGAMQKLFRECSRATVYNYRDHVRLADALCREGVLPKTYMAIPPAGNSEEVWDDISRMRTLNTTQSRRRQHLHVCPLQLDIVERVIHKYSSPGETVGDFFAGLMTVPVMAVRMGRKGWGCELNTDYFRDGVGYLEAEEAQREMPTLFDLVG